MPNKKPTLGMYKTHERNVLPEKATKGSACFDVAYQPHGKIRLRMYNFNNVETMRDIQSPSGKAFMMPGERMAIPTGVVYDIPKGHVLKVYSRSSVPLKKGLFLANSVGIIDEDYTDELFVILHNASNVRVEILPGERIAQVELVAVSDDVSMKEIKEAPKPKGDRSGGLGSTGA